MDPRVKPEGDVGGKSADFLGGHSREGGNTGANFYLLCASWVVHVWIPGSSPRMTRGLGVVKRKDVCFVPRFVVKWIARSSLAMTVGKDASSENGLFCGVLELAPDQVRGGRMEAAGGVYSNPCAL